MAQARAPATIVLFKDLCFIEMQARLDKLDAELTQTSTSINAPMAAEDS